MLLNLSPKDEGRELETVTYLALVGAENKWKSLYTDFLISIVQEAHDWRPNKVQELGQKGEHNKSIHYGT